MLTEPGGGLDLGAVLGGPMDVDVAGESTARRRGASPPGPAEQVVGRAPQGDLVDGRRARTASLRGSGAEVVGLIR